MEVVRSGHSLKAFWDTAKRICLWIGCGVWESRMPPTFLASKTGVWDCSYVRWERLWEGQFPGVVSDMWVCCLLLQLLFSHHLYPSLYNCWLCFFLKNLFLLKNSEVVLERTQHAISVCSLVHMSTEHGWEQTLNTEPKNGPKSTPKIKFLGSFIKYQLYWCIMYR